MRIPYSELQANSGKSYEDRYAEYAHKVSEANRASPGNWVRGHCYILPKKQLSTLCSEIWEVEFKGYSSSGEESLK